MERIRTAHRSAKRRVKPTVASSQWPERARIARLSKKLREQLALCITHPERVLFLDIETTGLSHHYDEITLIGWSIGGRSSTFVKGQCCNKLVEDAREAVALVTFNGIRFDKRFIQHEHPEIRLPDHHIDLMYLCRRVGLTGGQKAIERQLGLRFREDISDIDGFAAVLLWHQYLRGDLNALKNLIRYNRADIAAMGAILDRVLTELWLEPDLFLDPVAFDRWAAPVNWLQIPVVGVADPGLSAAPHFDLLFTGGAAASARVVGIDLTGSEKRGSGWSLLCGRKATMRTMFADDQILQETVAARPDLVSIDSPLCLPAGRLTVDDSDPERDRYGIMRQCERELKRRGVNVYPCLLPSMQKLTARGIRLADILRKHGIPVIESYPGAAQDIMRIPRKGAGIEWLKMGLREFGVLGDLDAATHDELDAVTSALVGMFHWDGMSEALGSEQEPPLIIPKLDGRPHSIIIGISGPIAAGKTTLAHALEERDFAYTRFSMVIDDELRARGKPLNRLHRQELGNEINKTGRQRWLAERTLARVGDAPLVVVDGLRFPDDHAFLAERAGGSYKHVNIDAREEVRRVRYEGRSSDGSFDAAASSEVEKQVESMRSLAHVMCSNNGSEADIASWAEGLVALIEKEQICPSQS